MIGELNTFLEDSSLRVSVSFYELTDYSFSYAELLKISSKKIQDTNCVWGD